MTGTVQIIGVAPSAMEVPLDTDGAARWCFNNPRMYRVRCPQALRTWTRWFNLHSLRHMLATYPDGYRWYGKQPNPIYLQAPQPDIPSSVEFPRATIQSTFNTNYFTSSASWIFACALWEGFDRIEFWGVTPDREYEIQRPCLSFWVKKAHSMGVEVVGPDFGEPGDPHYYTGPVYGFETS